MTIQTVAARPTAAVGGAIAHPPPFAEQLVGEVAEALADPSRRAAAVNQGLPVAAEMSTISRSI